MKIKTKLFLNVAIVASISIAISATSYVGMTFIKEKLTYLTEKSTPFQLRTLELQRSAQGASADLVKIGAAATKAELAAFVADAEKSLAAVKKAQDALEGMSSEKYGTHGELAAVYSSLARTMSSHLSANEEADSAGKALSQRLREALGALKDLDAKVKALQLTSSATYATSVDDRNDMAETQTSLATAKAQMNDVLVVVLQSQRGNAKRYRSQAKALLERIQQSASVRGNPKIRTEAKNLAAKTEEYFAARIGGDTAKADGMTGEVTGMVETLITLIGGELEKVNEKIGDATGRQGTNFTQSSVAVNALASNADLVARGTAIDGLVTRLINADTVKDVDGMLSQIDSLYGGIGKSSSDLERHLKKIKANRELGTLGKATASLAGIRSAVTATGGIAEKVKQRITLREQTVNETTKLRDIVVKLAEKGKQTEQTAQGEQEKSIAAVNGMIRKSLALILSIGGAAVIFGIGFGLWMYRAISGPLSGLVATAREIAAGNLNCTINSGRKDEIGQVQQAIVEMVENLKEIAKKIGQASATLASSSEELSASAVDLERGTDEQTAQIERTATAMTEMSQTINDVANSANSTAETASTMKETALGGKKKMHVAVTELLSFAKTIKTSSEKVGSLSEKSREISGIISLINDIADQTNLLALNAAIEAARAGEMGRGFAVVADEVRKLAEKTSHATGDIAKSINEMQKNVEESVGIIKNESDSVDTVVSIVNDSMGSIDTMVEDMEKISEMISRIAVASEQQSSTSDEISLGMNGVAEVARRVRTAFAEVKGSSHGLAETAAELNESAKWFKL